MREQPSEPNAVLLEDVRDQVDQTRIKLLHWVDERWLSVSDSGLRPSERLESQGDQRM